MGVAFLLLVICGGVNYLIDPYGAYQDIRKKYNYSKHINSDPYMFKAMHIKMTQPDSIVLGTSRAMRLDPAVIERLTGENAYNLGLPAATPFINYEYLKYSIQSDPKLKTVYLGLDFEVFEESYPVHANFNQKRIDSNVPFQDIFATLFSERALKDSYEVLIDNLEGRSRFTEYRYLADGSFDEKMIFPPNGNQLTLNMMPSKYSLSKNSIQYVSEIKELCEKHQIKLYIYISPIHAILLEQLWQSGLWSAYEDWKRALVGIAPIWDFSGYNEISMSELKGSANYNDLSHFSKKIGTLILARILDDSRESGNPAFGVYVTPRNLEDHLKNIIASRNLWEQRGEDMADLLKNY
jgi:hypothetical protein